VTVTLLLVLSTTPLAQNHERSPTRGVWIALCDCMAPLVRVRTNFDETLRASADLL
jgi:hypothetical protein